MSPGSMSVSRRNLLQRTGGAAIAVGLGLGGATLDHRRGALASQAAAGDTLRLAMVGDFIPSFYPLGTWTGNQFLLYNMFFSTLVELGPDLEVRSDLADEWSISDDATTFTFTLNSDATWHDGEPVTSRDVDFTFKFYLSDPTAVGFSTRLQQLLGAADFMSGTTDELLGIEIPDDATVILTLAEPNAFFIKALREPFHFILPAHVLDGVSAEEMQTHPFSTTSPVGSGPYQFVQMLPDQYVELEAYPNYFRGAPLIPRVFQKFLPSELVLAQLESGELDLGLRLNALEYDRIAGNANLDAIDRPGVGVVDLVVNNQVITDKRVRQAMWYAIDRQGIIDGILSGRAQSLKAPPGMTNYPGLNDYAFNPDQARTLLQEAGWDSGTPVRFIYDTVWPGITDIVPILQQQLTDVGFAVQLEPLDTAAWTERYRTQPDTWEIAWTQGGTEALDPDVSTLYYNNIPETAIGFYINDDLQQLFIAGRATGDPAQRDEIYAQVAQLINEEAPVIYLWSPYDIHGKVKTLQAIEVFPYAPETTNDVYKWQYE